MTQSAGPDARDNYGSTPRIRFLEFEGTRDICPWLAVPAAIDFQAELGWDAVRARIAELAEYTRRAIDPPARHSGRAGPARRDDRVRAARRRERPEAPQGTLVAPHRGPRVERPDRLLLRVSHHFYTTEEEIDRLAEVLPEVLAGCREGR